MCNNVGLISRNLQYKSKVEILDEFALSASIQTYLLTYGWPVVDQRSLLTSFQIWIVLFTRSEKKIEKFVTYLKYLFIVPDYGMVVKLIWDNIVWWNIW